MRRNRVPANKKKKGSRSVNLDGGFDRSENRASIGQSKVRCSFRAETKSNYSVREASITWPNCEELLPVCWVLRNARSNELDSVPLEQYWLRRASNCRCISISFTNFYFEDVLFEFAHCKFQRTFRKIWQFIIWVWNIKFDNVRFEREIFETEWKVIRSAMYMESVMFMINVWVFHTYNFSTCVCSTWNFHASLHEFLLFLQCWENNRYVNNLRKN